MIRLITLYTFLTLVILLSAYGILSQGSFEASIGHWNPLFDERLPRLLVILATGASLAVGGAVMQALFQNPLASPGALGVTAGGSLAVLGVFLSGGHLALPILIPLAAVGGCLITLLFVYRTAQVNGTVILYQLILTGIAVSTILMAIQSAVVYFFKDYWPLYRALVEWQSGTTFNRTWEHVHMQLPLTLVGLFGCLIYRKELNILSLGDEEAKNLGVDVDTIRWRLFLCVSLLAGGALAGMGIVAFFGLILPHLIRSLNGPDHKHLVPLSILAGGGTLAALDLALRALKIYTLSIGNVSAVVGGLFFFGLLIQSKKQSSELC